MKKTIHMVILSVIALLLQAQTANIVSAQNTQQSTIAKKLLTSANNGLNNRELDSTYIFANKLMNFSVKNELTYYEGQANKTLGNYYFLKGNNDSAIHYYNTTVQISDSYNYDTLRAKATTRIAITYKNKGNYDDAISYYTIALDFFTDNNIPEWSGVINDHMGLIYMKQGNYNKALEHMQNAITNNQQTGNIHNIGNAYNTIGTVYKERNNRQKAKEAYLNSIRVLSEIKETCELGMAYNNLASIYISKGETKLAVESMETGKQIFERTNYLSGLAGYYSVLSAYYNSKQPPEYYKVIESSKKGLVVAEEYNDYRQYAHATNVLGEAYLATNQIKKAESILKLGLVVAEKYKFNSISALITKMLSEVYEKKHQPQLALNYLHKYIVFNDSIINEEKIKEFTSLDLEFKFKQQQINDSLRQLQITQNLNILHEQEIHNQEQSKLILVFIIIIGFILAIFLFIVYRKSRIQSNLLSLKNDQINKSLLEKEALLKEVHHRVKNNFQTVSSLLDLQLDQIIDEKAIESINKSKNRIKSMALIHQMLYQNEDISIVDFQVYLKQLIAQIAALYSVNKLKIIINAKNIMLDIDTAIPLGLIINELVVNAFKYAFADDTDNQLTIILQKQAEENYKLTITDSGKGLPNDLNIQETKSLGLRLTQRLSKQLQGSCSYENINDSIFTVIFKDTNQRKEID